jgi:hypothetical protein
MPFQFFQQDIDWYRISKAGSHVAYNGTDIMILNRCTGLIQQVLSVQDFITYFHVLGEPIGTV